MRIRATLVSAALIGVSLWPLFREPPVDSFPHSTYPMFSRPRPARVVILQAMGCDEDECEPLPPDAVFDAEVMQAAATLRRAIEGGADARRRLCEQIAARVSASDDEALAPLIEVELVASRYDAVRYFEGETRPEQRRVHEVCVVER